MAFDGTEGGLITLKEGSAMTAAYRAAHPGETKGHFIGKDILNELLAQEDCMGLRIYYGIDEEGNKQIVTVGANSEEDDLLEKVADLTKPCPNYCGSSNALNS
jgi:hypothetical protein